jgi:hypothetical protein
VTVGAIKGGMLALELLELIVLLRMAGETGICDFTGKGDVQWRMWVLVTAETTLKLEMGLPHMALIALRYGFLNRRRMADMTA